jgi:hypothetical protein
MATPTPSRPDPPISLSSNGNDNNKDRQLDADVFFGMLVPEGDFWVYLLEHDRTFAKYMLKCVRLDDPEFRRYEVQDMIDDIRVNANPRGYYNRKGKNGAQDMQCFDIFEDIPHECARFRSPDEPIAADNTVPIASFPNMAFRRIREPGDNDGRYIRIGKEIPVYRNGKPAEQLPRLEVEQWTDELRPLMDATGCKQLQFLQR